MQKRELTSRFLHLVSLRSEQNSQRYYLHILSIHLVKLRFCVRVARDYWRKHSLAAAVSTAKAGQYENEPYEIAASHAAAAVISATATTAAAVQNEQEQYDVAAAASATATVIATVCKKVHSMYLRIIRISPTLPYAFSKKCVPKH